MMQLGRASLASRQTQRARESGIGAVELLGDDPGSDLVLAYGRMAALDVLSGHPAEAVEWANRAIDLASEIRFENVTRALGMRGLARADLGDPRGLEDLRLAVDLARELNLPAEDTAIAMGNLAEFVGLTEGVARGREEMEASLEYARSRGHVHHVMYVRTNLLVSLFHEGRWDELIAEADELIEWDRERGGTQLELWALSDFALALAAPRARCESRRPVVDGPSQGARGRRPPDGSPRAGGRRDCGSRGRRSRASRSDAR